MPKTVSKVKIATAVVETELWGLSISDSIVANPLGTVTEMLRECETVPDMA